MALDLSPAAVASLQKSLEIQKLSYGMSMGVYEWSGFASGTRDIAKVIAQTDYSLVGGGTLLLLLMTRLGWWLYSPFDWRRNCGYLEGSVLPGLKALAL